MHIIPSLPSGLTLWFSHVFFLPPVARCCSFVSIVCLWCKRLKLFSNSNVHLNEVKWVPVYALYIISIICTKDCINFVSAFSCFIFFFGLIEKVLLHFYLAVNHQCFQWIWLCNVWKAISLLALMSWFFALHKIVSDSITLLSSIFSSHIRTRLLLLLSLTSYLSYRNAKQVHCRCLNGSIFEYIARIDRMCFTQ